MPENAPESQRIIPINEYHGLNNIVPEYVEPLGVDLKRLNRIMLLGCIEEVSFSIQAGESSTYDAKVVGNVGGVALGGATRVRQSRLSRTRRAPDTSNPFGFCHGLASVNLDINSTAIQERVGSDARDPKAWAKHLNAAIGSGIRSATWNHLTKHPSIMEAAFGVGDIGEAVHDLYTGESQTIFEAYGDFMSGGAITALIAVVFREVAAKRVCVSAVPIIHTDRAALVSALTRFKPVVRPLNVEATA